MGFGNEKNFEIINDMAYTEDNVLIFNIFISYDMSKITEQQVIDYFNKFGPIKRINLRNNRRRPSKLKSGFINFTQSQAATQVLKINQHFINAVGIAVKACDSWYQPNAEKAVNLRAQHCLSADSVNSYSTTITDLNDDCLELICKKLNMKDQINFGRTCQSFSEVFRMLSKIEYKTLNLDSLETNTLWETRTLLQMVGPHIQTLTGTVPEKYGKRVIEFLGTYCRNVQAIRIFSSKLKADSLKKLLNKMSALTELDLYDTSLNDNSIQIFKRLPNLKKLILDENSGITGKFICQLKNITELSLSGCRLVESRYFQEICQNLNQLNTLDMKFCTQLKTKDYAEIVRCLENLETLKITCGVGNSQYECVAKLPKLKRLQIHAYDPYSTIRPELFTELAKHQSDKLQYLKLVVHHTLNLERCRLLGELKQLKEIYCAYNKELDDKCLQEFTSLTELEEINMKMCKNITNKGIMQLFSHCYKLKRVNLSHCTSLTDDFIMDLCKLLQEQHSKQLRQDRVLVIANQTHLNMFLTETPEFIACNDIVQISFDESLLEVEDFEDMFDFSDDSEFDEYDNELDMYDVHAFHASSDDDDDYVINMVDNFLGHYMPYDEFQEMFW